MKYKSPLNRNLLLFTFTLALSFVLHAAPPAPKKLPAAKLDDAGIMKGLQGYWKKTLRTADGGMMFKGGRKVFNKEKTVSSDESTTLLLFTDSKVFHAVIDTSSTSPGVTGDSQYSNESGQNYEVAKNVLTIKEISTPIEGGNGAKSVEASGRLLMIKKLDANNLAWQLDLKKFWAKGVMPTIIENFVKISRDDAKKIIADAKDKSISTQIPAEFLNQVVKE